MRSNIKKNAVIARNEVTKQSIKYLTQSKELKRRSVRAILSLATLFICLFSLTSYAQPQPGSMLPGSLAAQSDSHTTPLLSNTSNVQDQQAKIDALLNAAGAGKDNAKNTVKTSANTSSDTGSATPHIGLSDQAFATTIKNMMPLSPSQIKTLHYLFDKSQKAASQAPGVPPKPTSSSMVVNLSPGASPPVIRLSAGFVTSLVFLDATGKPWPIKAIDWGNPEAFNIQWNKKNNTLLVQALQKYRSGNLAVMLKGLDTPIMITLLPGQTAVDYRVDLRIPRLGPNADTADTSGLPSASSPNLLNVLDGVPPQEAKPLVITGCGGECRAWLVHKKLFLRTSLTVLSPAWTASMNSSDGTHAYELQPTPVILASDHGKLIQLNIKGLTS